MSAHRTELSIWVCTICERRERRTYYGATCTECHRIYSRWHAHDQRVKLRGPDPAPTIADWRKALKLDDTRAWV